MGITELLACRGFPYQQHRCNKNQANPSAGEGRVEVGGETRAAQVIKPDGKKGRHREGNQSKWGDIQARQIPKQMQGGFGNYRELDGVS